MSLRTSSSVFVIAIVFSRIANATPLPVSEAVQQRKVTITIQKYSPPVDKTYHPSYFEKCMQITVKNRTTTPLTLTQEAGRFLMPVDSDIQRMVTTASVAFALKAGEEKTIPLFAMCTEASDGAPSTEDEFVYGTLATGELKELVSFIASKNYQNEAAQSAVWVVTDDYSPYSIYDNDSATMNSLRRIVCKLRKISFDPKAERMTNNSPLMRYISGTFTFSIYKEQKVDLYVYTDDNKLIKSVVQGQTYSAGSHTVAYDVSIPITDPSKTQAIAIMFYLDGQLFAHRKHLLQSWR